MDKTEDIQHEVVAEKQTAPEIIVLKFADSKIPVFKETRSKNYIKYGEKNNYPEYLTFLFNKSAKHNAIVSGKANYVFGKGFPDGNIKINRLGETLNDLSKKANLDIELYGGFRFEIIWSRVGKVSEIYHVDYSTLRLAKEVDGEAGYYYKECWNVLGAFGEWSDNQKEEEDFIPAFNPAKPYGNQIFAYNEYRPMTRFYPLPSYIGCNNYIETDIEISKYYLSAIRNGMAPSKMIQFFKGEPTEDKKRAIERRMAQKFAGSENAGKFLLVFNDANASKSVEINDLSGSDLDKQFVELNKTCQQEIFSGHLVTSPMLFGIKTEGQLGGNTELATAYSIFQNTYSKPKAAAYSKEIQYLFSYSLWPAAYELEPSDPIGIQFDVKDVINSLPKVFVFEKLGIPQEQWNLPNVGSDNKPDSVGDVTAPVKAPAAPAPTTAANEAMANDNIKNLSTKQHQQLMRIIRQYGKGQLTEAAAKTLLRAGLNLSDDDINSILGIQPVAAQMSADSLDNIIAMFDECGESQRDYEILKTKKVSFSSELEMEADEEIFIQEAFKTYEVTASENEILELIKKDKRITPKIIAETIGETPAYVNSKIKSLVKRGYIDETATSDGVDEVIERTVEPKIDAPPIKPGDVNPAKVSIKYSYEVKPGIGAAVIATTRPFCRKMLQLHRLYSRADIETISQRLGYSVFDRKGGFWGDKPECRHRWVSHIVVQK